MPTSQSLRPLLAALLFTTAIGAAAWGGAGHLPAPAPWVGFSIGAPVIHPFGHYYPPRWPAYAPYRGGHGHYGYYAPPSPRHWRHFERHQHRRWAQRHRDHGYRDRGHGHGRHWRR
ncbi:MAG: hypothetical protein RLW62_10555 [Gammaproteobacteria bacterium]